jgi:hypothetical protein
MLDDTGATCAQSAPSAVVTSTTPCNASLDLLTRMRARKLLIEICFAATQGELQSRLARKLSQVGH